ncbi:hypothetical protein SCLCIDRAFT_26869 [Scleroderma citrinum Foug A]|uniref:Uncharacterized protein n=1 Tax=Scleroderma citrinum Foug A TaxID=1036808 RepID=A0A0C2ZEB9_9AGAM|nr:hypothetical protein SCLCIDRAFT_26869 [Scleroderma citrinum Foug A]
MRRNQDTLQPGYGAMVMLLSRENSLNTHPFWYAHVLDAFIISVDYMGVEWTMEFLWVRWFGVVPGYRWGLKNAHLPKIGFISSDSDAAFGFIDPSLILHACHLIPAFADGHTDSLLCHGSSVARERNAIDDWAVYYVNIFADRDIFARYTGVGVGHQAQYCLQTSLNHEACSSSSTGMQDELPTADEYSDEEDSYVSNDGGEGPQSASSDEESEDNDGAEDSEPDEDVVDEDMWSDEDEDGNNCASFKF